MDGRVKTLHPAVHGGLLARRDKPEHMAELAAHDITPIDLVVNNLYPFEATVNRDAATLEEAIENIDIGGPAMLRAAAKNYESVVVLCDPADYELTLEALSTGDVTQEQRRSLAAKAFQHVALYDTLVARYLRGDNEGVVTMPDELTIGLRKRDDLELRYGENPHQMGALYIEAGRKEQGVSGFEQLHGITMSFNNVLDADAAWRTAIDFASSRATGRWTRPWRRRCATASAPPAASACCTRSSLPRTTATRPSKRCGAGATCASSRSRPATHFPTTCDVSAAGSSCRTRTASRTRI
jgi:phosphoribosylaminoimidazolecarboxamide formyltransferase/IMP cyclohydrolase